MITSGLSEVQEEDIPFEGTLTSKELEQRLREKDSQLQEALSSLFEPTLTRLYDTLVSCNLIKPEATND